MVEQILDRNWKRSNIQIREQALALFVKCLMSEFCVDEVSARSDALVSAFVKSIKAEDSVRETILALKGGFDIHLRLRALADAAYSSFDSCRHLAIRFDL